MRALFWIPVGLLAWTHAGYGLFLAALRRAGAPAWTPPAPRADRPRVTLVIAAYREEAVIAGKVANALALDWPRDRLQVIVAVDGGAEAGADRTAELAREAGADVVLELARGGKYRAQAAAVGYATGDLLAFSDANSLWKTDALVHLAGAFADADVAYACGQVRFVNEAGTNQEGVYWRYEMWLREHESALASVTAGNGAIYAVRPDAFLPIEGHDLALPFNLVKRGSRAVFVPEARATEKMVPTVEGEWSRKRRMMSYAWPIVLQGGLLDPRGYPPLYALMMASHRLLRYASPFLHVLAALATLAMLGAAAPTRPRRSRPGRSPPPPLAGERVRGRCSCPLLRADDGRAGRRRCTTGSATAPRSAGRRRKARGETRRLPGVAPQARARPRRGRVRPVAREAGPRRRRGRDRLETHGHPVYRQRRVGREGRPFELYKLRTMVSGAESMGKGLAVDEGDDRITRLGAWLRRTSFDEVPNLVNVLRGEMSLVGPRRPCRSRSTLRRSPAVPARRPARHHRLGAGQRPRVAALARAHRARPLVRRARLARTGPEDPRPHGPPRTHGSGLYRGETGVA